MGESYEKTLTVCQATQGNLYPNAIKLIGDYLKAYGFQRGDCVKIYFTQKDNN